MNLSPFEPFVQQPLLNMSVKRNANLRRLRDIKTSNLFSAPASGCAWVLTLAHRLYCEPHALLCTNLGYE